MAIDRAAAALNFPGGIDTVSRKEHEQSAPPPIAKKIIFFNEDVSLSNVSKIFQCFTGKQLVDRVCRPSRDDFEKLKEGVVERQGVNALQWLENTEIDLDPLLREKAISVIRQLAELEIKENIQRNLLQRV